jgi:hypothetical protein
MRREGFESGSGVAATVVRIPVGASKRATPIADALTPKLIIVAAAGVGMHGITDDGGGPA